MLPDSFLLELKYRTDIEQLIGGYTQLKRSGRNLTGLCPFHSEKSPSFVVYTENQSFYCFGCGAGGDAITFVRRAENLDYLEAVRLLADRAGLPMPDDGADDAQRRQRMRIQEMNREAARWFHQQLMSDVGRRARAYLVDRGLSKATVTRFGLGYAPDRWNALTDYLRSKGYTTEEMTAAYLVQTNKKGHSYDVFRDRIIFPIIDLRGSVIAFGGRNLGEHGPKYLNSGDTPVFKKSRNLFALNFAKKSARKELILAEGYMDVIALHQGGFDNAVATLGTALTSEQARLVAQYTDQVIISYDSDGPGQEATRRATGILEQAGLKVRVLTMTGAKDPDEYIKKFGAQKFELLLNDSRNVLDYQIEQLRSQYDVTQSDGKVSFLQAFVRLMAQTANPIQREVYLSRICRDLEVDKQALTAQLEVAVRRQDAVKKRRESAQLRPFVFRGAEEHKDPDRLKNPRNFLAGEQIIAYLVRHPNAAEHISGRISPEEFISKTDSEIYRAVLEKLQSGGVAEAATLSSVLSPEQLGRFMEITTKEVYHGASESQLEDCIRSLKENYTQKTREELSSMEDDEFGRYIASITANK